MSISMSIFPILNISIISLKIDISISCLLDIIFPKILGSCDIVRIRARSFSDLIPETQSELALETSNRSSQWFSNKVLFQISVFHINFGGIEGKFPPEFPPNFV